MSWRGYIGAATAPTAVAGKYWLHLDVGRDAARACREDPQQVPRPFRALAADARDS